MRLFHRSTSSLGRGTEWFYVFACTWFIVGLFLDGWAHNHVPELESFFTPWHAVFYSGFMLMALTLGVLWLRTRKKSVPAGYGEAMVGAWIFLAGGIGDMLWHEAFGVEKDIEALFSPTHLVLAVGTVLMLGAPFLAVLRAGKAPKTFVDRLPAILSLTYALSTVMFLTQFHHWSDLRLTGDLPMRSSAELRQALAMAGYLWHMAVLMAGAIMLLRALPRSFGAMTILFTASTFGMAVMRMWEFNEAVPVVCIAYIVGFMADLWMEKKMPIEKHLASFRWFTAAIPAALIALLHGYAIPLMGTWWSIHMWSGAVAIAACVGLLVGLAMVPPSKN